MKESVGVTKVSHMLQTRYKSVTHLLEEYHKRVHCQYPSARAVIKVFLRLSFFHPIYPPCQALSQRNLPKGNAVREMRSGCDI